MSLLSRVRAAEPELPFALIVAFALTAIALALQADVGLWPQDEGFLWYGVVHTAQGEVPLRDFRSYDPGRYFWCAAWSFVFGDGFIALRVSCALFQALGLACGLLAARRAVAKRWMLVPIGALLLAWMFPPWKLFESSLAMAAVYVAVLVIEKPSAQRLMCAGVFNGFAAFMGRNHGVYIALAFVAAILLVTWKEHRVASSRRVASRIATWGAGIVIGFSPMLFMLAFTPGFARAFLESILFFARQSSLNAAHPVPWPWTVDFAHDTWFTSVQGVTLGACFVLGPLAYAAGVFFIARARRDEMPKQALLAAALLVGLPYVHHVTERSDVYHLAQCIHPFLLVSLAMPAAIAREHARSRVIGITAGMLALSAFAIAPSTPAGRRLAARGTSLEYVPFDIAGDPVWIDAASAQRLDAVRKVIAENLKPGEKLWLSPKLLVLYPMLGRRSPVWDIYPEFKADEALEARMIEGLSDVKLLVLVDVALGGQEEMRFYNAYPQTWEKLRAEFDRIATPDLPENHVVLRRR